MEYYINIWKNASGKLCLQEGVVCETVADAIDDYNQNHCYIYMHTIHAIPGTLDCYQIDIEEIIKTRREEEEREAESDREHEISMSAPDRFFDKE